MPVLGLVAGWPARRWALARFGRDAAETEPGYARRIVAAFVDGVANALAPVAVIAVVVGAMVWQGLLDGLFRDVVFAASVAGAAFLVVFGVARAALSPYLVAWRIVPVEPDYAGRLLAAIRAVAGVFSVAGALLVIAHSAGRLSGALESAFFTVQTSVAALAIVWALTPRYWAGSIEQSQKADVGQSRGAEVPDESPQDADHPRRRQGWRHMANLLRAAVLLTPVLALFGYGRLAFFLQSRLVATGVLVGFGLLLRLSLHEMLARVFARRHRGAGVADESGVAGHVGQYWVGLILDAAVFLPLGYLLLLVYGVPGTTLSLWVSRLLSGFTVGDITVSFTGVLYGALIFAVGIVATNLIRRWLANRVLPNTRLDSGARNSIASGTGYVGVALSVLFAVGALGIDFSNLALVAGALSLGIGFGLQNVVQNFAAGLLVLIERPVKVGDWIVVGSTEGTVKHISVRSTEIETFDRSSVIVPNSDLVSTAVTNWTHKNRIARIIVPVGVAYDSDARQVQRVLLECAAAQERVMSYPEPMALFVGFGDSALNFELRCYVTDTAYYLTTTSDLHFAIEEAFRREGIRIPFPQREITMRQA
jgi:small-conductance mechanosensitive channel